MFLYPLAIVLILLTLCGSSARDRVVLQWTAGFSGSGGLTFSALPKACVLPCIWTLWSGWRTPDPARQPGFADLPRGGGVADRF
ncbi:MAG: hypothetical protein ACLS8R_04655 [Anaeromassilibacillus sp.]